MEKKKSNNVVVYCSSATVEQDGGSYSLEAQERKCTEYATAKGLKVVGTFKECGVSGLRLDKPQLQKMLAYCGTKENDVSAVICLGGGRLNRSYANYLSIVSSLSKNGVELLFVVKNNTKGKAGCRCCKCGIPIVSLVS